MRKMSITPIDILHTQFKTTFRGYSKAQVDEFVRAAGEALEGAFREKCELQRKVDQLQEDVDRVRKIESTMTEALTLAQKSADELRAAAHKQAEAIIQEAEHARVRLTADAQTEAEKYRADVELLQATRDRFESEFKAMLGVYQDWLDRRKGTDLIRSEVA
jgi:cell division initiation protein